MTKQIRLGGVTIGGGTDIAIQSMLSLPWEDAAGNIRQARELAAAGCDIVRVAVPTKEAVALIPALKEQVHIPVVADIHFDYRLALESVAAGADKIRLNPGNIGGEDRVRAVAMACREKGVPIRIGVNSGSLEREILARHGHPTAEAIAESALYHAALLEKHDFTDIVLSLKSSGVKITIDAYRKITTLCDYPLHLGITEAGTSRMGLIKSAIGIGGLLADGIGDTIRVSLTAPPVEEIRAAKDILKAVGRGRGPVVISCPTCGRTRIDLLSLAGQVEAALEDCTLPITVAVMGCAVNGPGEAREADLGVAGGDGVGLLFRKGEVLRRVPQAEIVPVLLEEIRQMEINAAEERSE